MSLLLIICIAILSTLIVASIAFIFHKAIDELKIKKFILASHDGDIDEPMISEYEENNATTQFFSRFKWSFLLLLIAILLVTVSIIVYSNPNQVQNKGRVSDIPSRLSPVDPPKPTIIEDAHGIRLSFRVDENRGNNRFSIYVISEASNDSLRTVNYFPDVPERNVTTDDWGGGFYWEFVKPIPDSIMVIVQFEMGAIMRLHVDGRSGKVY